MVEAFKIKQKIRKRFALKKPNFDSKFDYLNYVLISRQPWSADNYDDFLVINQKIISIAEEQLKKPAFGTKGIFKDLLHVAQQRAEFASIAQIYYPAVDNIVEAIGKKSKEEALRAKQIMEKALAKCNEVPGAKNISADIQKKISELEKEFNGL